MPYVDSNVFIYPMLYSVGTSLKARKAREILLQIENGELSAFTSTLTWDEVVWVISKQLSRSEGMTQGRKLLGFPNLQFIHVDECVLGQAQNLMDKYALSPRDSIHAASTLEARTNSIISDDEDFDQVKELERISLE